LQLQQYHWSNYQKFVLFSTPTYQKGILLLATDLAAFVKGQNVITKDAENFAFRKNL